MKKFIFISIIILFLSCSDEDDITIQSQLIGRWKWVESSGGIAGTTENPQSTGKEVTVEFTSNTKKTYINGVLEYESTYYIEIGESIRSLEKIDLIIYENSFKQSIEINDDYLVLFDEIYDGLMYEYIRD